MTGDVGRGCGDASRAPLLFLCPPAKYNYLGFLRGIAKRGAMPPPGFQSSRESILGVDFLKFPKRGVSGAWRSLAILGDLTSRDFSEAFS
ncbi:MAG: hypothetical protein WBF12_14220, partial [Bradyrhizobium sp.]